MPPESPLHPAAIAGWILTMATRLLARSLNMPEPLVASTGAYVFAHVAAVETRAAKTLCPFALARRLRAWFRNLTASVSKSPPQSTRRTAMINPSLFLRRALIADAIFSGVAALGFTFGAGSFASLFNLPEVFLREVGLFLIGYAAFVGWLGSRQTMMKALVLIVIAGNAAWTLGSIALLFSGSVSPNALGMVMVVAQAIATGVFAELQYIGLRKSGGTVTA